MKEDRNIPVCCGLFFANSDPRLPGYLGYPGYPTCFYFCTMPIPKIRDNLDRHHGTTIAETRKKQ